MIAYVELSLGGSSHDLADPAEKEFLESLTFIVLEVGLKTSHEDILFGHIYEKFVESGVETIFLDSLTSHILDGSVKRTLTAPVVNAYIDRQVTGGHIALVEQVLTYLDVSILDLNFVTKVCLTHRLFSGLIYLYTEAFKDWKTPAFELLKIVRQFTDISAKHPEWTPDNIPDQEARSLRDNCYQFMVYLAYTWTGKAYPVGLIPEEDQVKAKTSLYTLIFSETFTDNDCTTAPSPPLVHCIFYTYSPTLFFPAVVKKELPFPYLRLLINFDFIELLRVLTAAFDDPSLNDLITMWPLTVDLSASDEKSPPPAFLNRQTIVDILLRLVAHPLGDFSVDKKATLFIFIAKNMSRHESLVTVNKKNFETILTSLTSSSDTASKKEKQQALLDLLKVYRPSEVEYEKLILLCENARYFKVCEEIYRRLKRYQLILHCYMDDESRKLEVFRGIKELLGDPKIDEESRTKLKKTVVASIPDLIKIDGTETATLVLQEFSEEHNNVMQKLEAFPNLQYQYLRGFLNHNSKKSGETRAPESPEMHEKYLELMCKLEPVMVYKYLQTTEK